MEYLSVAQFAKKYGVSERTARNYCAQGKIEGAFLTGKTWNIPADAELPRKKNAQMKGGIYHRTQIDLTYNSNHKEGSRLTHEKCS